MRCPEASGRPGHDQPVSVRERQDELSHSPRLFDWWRGDVRSRGDCAHVRRVQLSPHIYSHGDGGEGWLARHQPNTWADAPRTENHADYGRRIADVIERPRAQYGPQHVEILGDIENWKSDLDTEHCGGFWFARPTENDRFVWFVAVRIPLRAAGPRSAEAESARSRKGADVRRTPPRLRPGQNSVIRTRS